MIEHSGLIANCRHKGEDLCFVTSEKPCPVLITESDYRDDASESNNTIATKNLVGSKEEYTPM